MTRPGGQCDRRRSEAPFTAADVLETRSLSRALKTLVFSHPTVRASYARAKIAAEADGTLAQLEEHGGLIGECFGHDEPLLPLRYFEEEPYDVAPLLASDEPEEDPKIDAYFTDNGSPEIGAYYETVLERVETLLEILHSGQVIGVGHTADGNPVRIQQSIWRHPTYYVEPRAGNIYDANTNPMTRTWSGVAFERNVAAIKSEVSREADRGSLKTITYDAEPSPAARKGIARVQTKVNARNACTSLLTALMRSSPEERTHTNAELWEMARAKWPGALSERAFQDARAAAITAASAPAWGAAGRPRKSPRT
jgi:hypothetical protein